jgi:hypothetical protein
MTTSGICSFSPALGSMALNAFARCGVRRTEITPQHMEDAYLESNYLQQRFQNDGLTLWTVDLQTIPLIQGTATYDVPVTTVQILDLYIIIGSGNNRLITPFSRTDYASLANPATQGIPTSFWFDRLATLPTITFWPVPDGNETSAQYYRYRNIQDANIRQGGNIEVPYLWLDAFAAGLAHRLARIYAPALEQQRKADFDEAYASASKQNTENVPLYFQPGLSGYYR